MKDPVVASDVHRAVHEFYEEKMNESDRSLSCSLNYDSDVIDHIPVAAGLWMWESAGL